MADLAEARRFYAEELKYVAGIETPALVEAFVTVPREAFLGPGPWSVNGEARFRPRITPDDDPRHVYHDVLVSIDPSLNLNNGAPSLWSAGSRARGAARKGHGGPSAPDLRRAVSAPR